MIHDFIKALNENGTPIQGKHARGYQLATKADTIPL